MIQGEGIKKEVFRAPPPPPRNEKNRIESLLFADKDIR